MRRFKTVSLFLVALLLVSNIAFAQTDQPVAEPVAEPEAVAEPATEPATEPEAVAEPVIEPVIEPEVLIPEVAPVPVETVIPVVATPEVKPVEETKKAENVLSKLGNFIKFYGFLRLDISYDTSRTNAGNWAMLVKPNKSFARKTVAGIVNVDPGNDAELAISARLTRFGMNFNGPKIEMLAAKVGGKLEIDFFGGDITTGDWKALPRFRQAYLTLDWDWFQLKAGQSSDLISPMFPRIDYNGGSWMMGNVGARRPQLQLTFKPTVGEKGRFFVQAAIARAGTVDNADNDISDVVDANEKVGVKATPDGNNDGEDAAVPMLMGRIAYKGALWTKKPFVIGISGHWEQYQMRHNVWDVTNGVFNKVSHRYQGYSLNAELQLPILDWWVLRSEVFFGSNMADIFGGAYQGINKEGLIDTGDLRIEGVKSLGFWVDTTIQPFDMWAFTIGFMADMPDSSTLPSDTTNFALIESTRYRNMAGYAHSEFIFGGGFSIGLEYTRIMTEYKYIEDTTAKAPVAKSYYATNNRIRTYFMYKF